MSGSTTFSPTRVGRSPMHTTRRGASACSTGTRSTTCSRNASRSVNWAGPNFARGLRLRFRKKRSILLVMVLPLAVFQLVASCGTPDEVLTLRLVCRDLRYLRAPYVKWAPTPARTKHKHNRFLFELAIGSRLLQVIGITCDRMDVSLLAEYAPNLQVLEMCFSWSSIARGDLLALRQLRQLTIDGLLPCDVGTRRLALPATLRGLVIRSYLSKSAKCVAQLLLLAVQPQYELEHIQAEFRNRPILQTFLDTCAKSRSLLTLDLVVEDCADWSSVVGSLQRGQLKTLCMSAPYPLHGFPPEILSALMAFRTMLFVQNPKATFTVCHGVLAIRYDRVHKFLYDGDVDRLSRAQIGCLDVLIMRSESCKRALSLPVDELRITPCMRTWESGLSGPGNKPRIELCSTPAPMALVLRDFAVVFPPNFEPGSLRSITLISCDIDLTDLPRQGEQSRDKNGNLILKFA
jgi:hypothetical protein